MTTPKRNQPCPCGSGKKYKKCCMNAAPAAAAPRTSPDLGDCREREEDAYAFEDLQVVPVDLERGRLAAESYIQAIKRSCPHCARRNLVARPLPGLGVASPMMLIVDADTNEAVGSINPAGLTMENLRRAYPDLHRIEDFCLEDVP
jgi:hypothetical protein